jgi:hypothetical protein
MRILYIYLNAPINEGSIKTKIVSQIHYLNKAGVVCEGAFFSKEIKSTQTFNEFIKYQPSLVSTKKWFKRIHQQKLMMLAVETFLQENHQKFDLIYFRYSGANSVMHRIMRKFGRKICMEHNAKEFLDIAKQAGQYRKIWKPSNLLSFIAYIFIPLFQEVYYGVRIRRKALLGTCVSNEMAAYQKKHSLGSYHVVPISNGIDIEKNPVRKAPRFDGSRLNILFLKGTSGAAPRNGIDRIITSMLHYKGSASIHLYVAGTNSDGEFTIPETLKDNVHISGYLTGKGLDEIFDTCHIAAGTMALFRQGEHENAVLKLRMYAARGIPFIYAYRDMDLKDKPEAAAWSKEYPNDNSLIPMETILEFAEQALAPAHEQVIRKYAEQYLGYDSHMKRLAGVLKAAVKQRTH